MLNWKTALAPVFSFFGLSSMIEPEFMLSCRLHLKDSSHHGVVG